MLYKGTFTNNLAGCEEELFFSSDDINKVYDFMQNNLYDYLMSYEHLAEGCDIDTGWEDEDLLEDYYDSGDYEVEEIKEVDEDEEIIKL